MNPDPSPWTDSAPARVGTGHDDEQDEQARRHRFRNDLTSAAAQMQATLEQVRQTRLLLLEMVHANQALQHDEGTSTTGQV